MDHGPWTVTRGFLGLVSSVLLLLSPWPGGSSTPAVPFTRSYKVQGASNDEHRNLYHRVNRLHFICRKSVTGTVVCTTRINTHTVRACSLEGVHVVVLHRSQIGHWCQASRLLMTWGTVLPS